MPPPHPTPHEPNRLLTLPSPRSRRRGIRSPRFEGSNYSTKSRPRLPARSGGALARCERPPRPTLPTNRIDSSPCPMASQARHKLGAPNESISSRSVVLARGGEGFASPRFGGQGAKYHSAKSLPRGASADASQAGEIEAKTPVGFVASGPKLGYSTRTPVSCWICSAVPP
jgi:hypothetical protein